MVGVFFLSSSRYSFFLLQLNERNLVELLPERAHRQSIRLGYLQMGGPRLYAIEVKLNQLNQVEEQVRWVTIVKNKLFYGQVA